MPLELFQPSLQADSNQQVKCPACGQFSLYAAANVYRPFCGKLCRATDLGRWAHEEFKIPIKQADIEPDLQ